jgi:hypothetical protein
MSIIRGDQTDAAVRVADGSRYVSASAGVLRATATGIGSAVRARRRSLGYSGLGGNSAVAS